MEARWKQAVVLAAVLLVSMGARHPSANFIVDTPDPKLAAQIAQAAEKYRHDLAVSWLGEALPNWSQPCVMTVQVGPHLGAGGATTFVFDQGEVFGWRMSIQGSAERILDSVLPHEITHMIFASRFRCPVPRWADEGGATSVEHAAERNKHRQMLYQFLHTGRGIAFNQMFAMREYPSDVMPLYAQGYSLAEYLIQTGGRRKYVDFLGDGLKSGDWPGAVKRHYGAADLGALQNTWLAWVREGSPQLKARQEQPTKTSPAEMLAAAARRPRPEPNLVIRVGEQQPKARLLGPLEPVAHHRDRSGPDRGFSSPPQQLATPQPLAAAVPRSEAKALPASGWRAAGTPAPNAAAASVASVASATPPAASVPTVDPFRAHVTRPQPSEPPRQVILEWSRQ